MSPEDGYRRGLPANYSGLEKAGVSSVDQLMGELEEIKGILPPKNKTEKRILRSHLGLVTADTPLEIYVGSCPDYSHMDGLYTHTSLGEGVPLLTTQHLRHDTELLKLLEKYNVPYSFYLLIADVEATDDVFAAKFTGGSVPEFMRRCGVSMKGTETEIERIKDENKLTGNMVSSSFFGAFTLETFMDYQRKYSEVLKQKYDAESNFRTRIHGDIAMRMGMYSRMYDGAVGSMTMSEKQLFFVSRTIRTMAQYLVLGRLISERSAYPIIINHPTRNLSVFNDRNKYPLREDSDKPQKTVPVFEMTSKVY
jgi:hypothetical protein